MKKFFRATLVSVLLLSAAVAPSFGQEKKLVSGNSVNLMFPIGDMASTYNFGWGFYGNIDYNINKLLVGRFDLGWNSVSGPDYDDPVTGLPQSPKMDVWEFTAGLRLRLAMFYLEGRGGYFTGVDSWGYVPAVGLRLGKLDIQGNLNIAGDNHWGGVRIAFYWGGK